MSKPIPFGCRLPARRRNLLPLIALLTLSMQIVAPAMVYRAYASPTAMLGLPYYYSVSWNLNTATAGLTVNYTAINTTASYIPVSTYPEFVLKQGTSGTVDLTFATNEPGPLTISSFYGLEVIPRPGGNTFAKLQSTGIAVSVEQRQGDGDGGSNNNYQISNLTFAPLSKTNMTLRVSVAPDASVGRHIIVFSYDLGPRLEVGGNGGSLVFFLTIVSSEKTERVLC